MAKNSCDFVKGAKAAWHCTNCHTNYSERCIPDGYNPMWGRDGPTCILCHDPLVATDDPSLHRPFWQALPYLFSYPLHINALLVMLVGGGGIYVLGGGLMALVYAIIFSIMLVKYYVAVVAERAAGRRNPPGLITFVKPDPYWLFVQMILVYVLFGVGIAAATILVNGLAGLGAAIFVAAVFPASTMILAIEKNCLKAVNPLDLLSLIATMGIFPYLTLWLMTALIGLGPVAAEKWLLPQVPEAYEWAVALSIAVYFSMVVHALMGYALFQYRDPLGLPVEGEFAPKLEEKEFHRAKSLGAVQVLQKRGDYERARDELRNLLDICRDDLELHRQYQDILLKTDDREALAKHTDYLASLLLEAGKRKEVLKLIRKSCEVMPDYKVTHPGTAVKIGRELEKAKEYQLLVKILANLHKRSAPGPDVASAYAMVAKTLAGPLNQPAKARAVATYVLKQYPKAPEAAALAKLARVG